MSSDKRRRARIQGGWAAGPSKPRSDSDKEKIPANPNWCAKNIDTHNPSQVTQPLTLAPQTQPDQEASFVFQKPEKDIVEEVKARVIEKAGVYDLSSEPSGVSRIRFFPHFIEEKDREWMFDQLFHELPWKQRSDYVSRGTPRLQPRLTAWFGEHPYSYSGQTLEAYTNWTPLLQQLKERLEDNTGLQFNSVLANLYRDGHDSVGWHCDNEEGLGPQPTIASLSFGDLRNFEMRKIPPKIPGDESEPVYTEHIKVPIDAGSLLIMEGATQDDWQHRVPIEYHDRGPRINLTFRVIFPVD